MEGWNLPHDESFVLGEYERGLHAYLYRASVAMEDLELLESSDVDRRKRTLSV